MFKEFRNFDWKKYIYRVSFTWAILLFFFGFISGTNAQENQESSIWVLVGESEDYNAKFYYMRNAMIVNQVGNPIVIMKVVVKDIGTIYGKWEIDCKNKVAKRFESGKSLDSMVKIEREWEAPTKDSIMDKVIQPICLIGGN